MMDCFSISCRLSIFHNDIISGDVLRCFAIDFRRQHSPFSVSIKAEVICHWGPTVPNDRLLPLWQQASGGVRGL